MATETLELTGEDANPDGVLPPQAVRPKNLRVRDVLLVMSVAFAPLLLSSAYGYFLRRPMAFNKWDIASLILHECIGLGVLAYVLAHQGRSVRDIGLRFRFSDVGIGILLSIAGMIAISLSQFGVFLWQFASGKTSQGAPIDPVSLSGLGLLGIVFVVLNPIFEEVLVRGYLIVELSLLTRRSWIPPLASALLQGSYHLYQGVPNAIAVTACFLVWSLYFAKTRKLGPIIWAHFMGDAYALYVHSHK